MDVGDCLNIQGRRKRLLFYIDIRNQEEVQEKTGKEGCLDAVLIKAWKIKAWKIKGLEQKILILKGNL